MNCSSKEEEAAVSEASVRNTERNVVINIMPVHEEMTFEVSNEVDEKAAENASLSVTSEYKQYECPMCIRDYLKKYRIRIQFQDSTEWTDLLLIEVVYIGRIHYKYLSISSAVKIMYIELFLNIVYILI